MRMGVDLDTWKLTLCVIDADQIGFETCPLRERNHSLFDAIQGVAPSLSLAIDRLGAVPDEVYIERGRGQHRKGEYELGAIYGATAVAVRRIIPNAHVETVPLSDWKRAVTAAIGITTMKGVPGNGNAPKAVANEACRTILSRDGFEEPGRLSPDELDAFGIVWSQGAYSESE